MIGPMESWIVLVIFFVLFGPALIAIGVAAWVVRRREKVAASQQTDTGPEPETASSEHTARGEQAPPSETP